MADRSTKCLQIDVFWARRSTKREKHKFPTASFEPGRLLIVLARRHPWELGSASFCTGYALTGCGRRCAHGRAASSWAASASSAPSPAGRPTSCTASGRPSSPWNSGSEIAGLAGGVEDGGEGREQTRAGERRHRVRGGGVERAERQRALGQRGGEQRVVGLQELRSAGGRTPAAAAVAPRLSMALSLPDHRVDRPAHRLDVVLCRRLAARRRSRRRRSTARCGCRTPRRTAPAGRRPPRRLDLLDLVAERAQQLGGVARRPARRAGRRPRRRSAAAWWRRSAAPGPGSRRAAVRRTARAAAGPRWRRRARSRRARRGSPRCRRRCA